MLSIPPPNILQPLIDRPFPKRPLILRFDHVHEAGVRDHLFQERGDGDLFAELLGGFNGEEGAVVEGGIWRDGVVVGFEDGVDFGVFEVASWSEMAVGGEGCQSGIAQSW